MIGHLSPVSHSLRISAGVRSLYPSNIADTSTNLPPDRLRPPLRARDAVEARLFVSRGNHMYAPAGVKTSTDYPIPDAMKAWVLGDPGELSLREKPVPVPKKAEVLVRIDAVAIYALPISRSSITGRRR